MTTPLQTAFAAIEPERIAEPPGRTVADLIAVSNSHFDTAQRELQQGHLETAKVEFNREVGCCIASSEKQTNPTDRMNKDIIYY